MTVASRRILVVVEVDPRTSDRAVEALRMSVGLAAAGNEVTVLLRDGAEALLSPERDSLPGGSRAAGFLDGLARLGASVEADDVSELDPADAVIRWTDESNPRNLLGDRPEDGLPLDGDPTAERAREVLDQAFGGDRAVIW